jgi:hypothetical protein
VRKRDRRGWTRNAALRVVSSVRDRRATQAASRHSNLPDHQPADPSLRRLAALERLLTLGDPDALREWRLSQMAALGINQT